MSTHSRAFVLRTAHGDIDLDRRCALMGVLNVTPDSFSDGGAYPSVSAAVKHGLGMIEEGADIVDIGGESTRPGAPAVPAQEEIHRILPVISALRERTGVPISVDTRKAQVAEAALDAGADIINDVSGLRDDAMAALAASRRVPVVIMHMQGEPESMQHHPEYSDVVNDLLAYFRERLAYCDARGIDQIMIDPGIGFGKTLQHNLALLRGLARLADLGRPVLVGTSRKSFLGALTGKETGDRLPGTIASSVIARSNGAHILRVHDVGAVRDALRVAEAILQGQAEG